MKKLIFLMAAALMLTSCGGQKPVEEEKQHIGDRGHNEVNFETNEKVETVEILSEEEADFGNFKWGMTLEDVTNVHGGGYTKISDDKIRYDRIRIEELASDAEYEFKDGKLVCATYFILPDQAYKDETQYLRDYNSLVGKYVERFGKPVLEEKQFAEGKETDDEKEIAKLLTEQMVMFRTVWETDTTEIRVNMGINNGKIVIGIRNIPLSK